MPFQKEILLGNQIFILLAGPLVIWLLILIFYSNLAIETKAKLWNYLKVKLFIIFTSKDAMIFYDRHHTKKQLSTIYTLS